MDTQRDYAPTMWQWHDNLYYAYGLHNYNVSKIWNYDEFGVQVGCNGDAFVFVKIG